MAHLPKIPGGGAKKKETENSFTKERRGGGGGNPVKEGKKIADAEKKRERNCRPGQYPIWGLLVE